MGIERAQGLFKRIPGDTEISQGRLKGPQGRLSGSQGVSKDSRGLHGVLRVLQERFRIVPRHLRGISVGHRGDLSVPRGFQGRFRFRGTQMSFKITGAFQRVSKAF